MKRRVRMMLERLIKKIKYHLSTEWCYDRMEADGIASMGRCCGVVGGTRATDYLSEMCIGCPHWVPVKEEDT